jgi:hypothetical protein
MAGGRIDGEIIEPEGTRDARGAAAWSTKGAIATSRSFGLVRTPDMSEFLTVLILMTFTLIATMKSIKVNIFKQIKFDILRDPFECVEKQRSAAFGRR